MPKGGPREIDPAIARSEVTPQSNSVLKKRHLVQQWLIG